MANFFKTSALALSLFALVSCGEKAAEAPEANEPPQSREEFRDGVKASRAETRRIIDELFLVSDYYPENDPAVDLEQAMAKATAENKNILLDVGGEWCIWCHILDHYIATHPSVAQAIRENFVAVKVNYSEENENTEFLGQFPEAEGYPHIYILGPDGTFLHSQGTGVLEDGESYSEDALLTFLSEWSPE